MATRSTGGSFRAAVDLFPVLEGARADADEDEDGELGLAETEFFAHGLGIRPLQDSAAGGFLFAAKNGPALLEAGGELLEEIVFYGNSVLMMDLRILSWRE